MIFFSKRLASVDKGQHASNRYYSGKMLPERRETDEEELRGGQQHEG